MAVSGFQPDDWGNCISGHFLTFIIPALSGCNLKCSFCVIAQREEISDNILGADDYVRFIRGVAHRLPVAAIALQGYEPLLPSALPYTAAILRTGRELAIPCSLVTNGVYLRNALPLLAELGPNRIGISLDAAAPDRHDRLRSVTGAWAATVQGIRDAASVFARSGTRLTVISTLMPRRAAYLHAMPKLLRELGVRDWVINPLLSIGTDCPGRFPGRSQQLLSDCLELQQLAEDEGVHVAIDDEFDLLRPSLDECGLWQYAALNVKTLPPDVTISRLLPSGHCSVGVDILSKLPPDAPRWRPGIDDPARFLRGLMAGNFAIPKAA